MEKKKKSFKLIHLILIGVIFMSAIFGGVLFFNKTQLENSDKIVANAENRDGLELSVGEVKILDRYVLIKYNLKINDEELQEIYFNSHDIAIFSIPTLEMENEILEISNYVPNIINRIDEKNYELWFVYDLDELELKDGAQLVSDLHIRKFVEEGTETLGEWTIYQNLKSEYKEQHAVYNKLDENIRIPVVNTKTKEKVAEYCLCNIVDSSEYMILKLGTIESWLYDKIYKLDVKLGEHSILAGEQDIAPNCGNNIILNTSNIYTNKINIEITTYDSEEELSYINGNLEVLLGNMIIEEDKPETKPYTLDWRGLRINYDTNDFEVVPNASDDYGDNYYLSFRIKEKISQEDYEIDYIDIWKYENKLNYDLEQLYVEYEKLMNADLSLTRAGGDGTYKIYDYDENNNQIEYILNKEQLYDFADGKDVKIDENTMINKRDFYLYEYNEFRNKELVKIAGQDALTFISKESYNTKRYYIFIVDNVIYQISIPTVVGPYLTAQEFIENLELAK